MRSAGKKMGIFHAIPGSIMNLRYVILERSAGKEIGTLSMGPRNPNVITRRAERSYYSWHQIDRAFS